MTPVALWLASHFAYQATQAKRPSKPKRIAHRGAAAYAPENTLEACLHGIRLGADYLEVDVRQAGDGKLVLMHDSSLRRTTGRSGRVETSDSQGLPTFDQFLQLASQHRIGIFPEIKGHGIEEAMVQAIHAHGLQARTIIPAFSSQALHKVHQLDPQIPLCQLLYPWELLLRKPQKGVTIVAPMAEGLLLSPWIVRQAHRRGLKVWPWFAGLENAFTVRFLRSLGVDGLIVNDPAFRDS